ncbi:hypothetical protein FHX15_005168 [Rhizobium sp. BK650]|uniref:hypothetical protein n=1 Tax=Rhizobium sp. BK650 TaxID=2586990 RepID=UPI00161CEA62|nr:hypothetical protein [Rhizobium sp. BK650]MBB3659899.1 hypothetical protein [Rhizobium sp. BK650]
MGRLRRVLRLTARHNELERGLVVNAFRALVLDDFDASFAEEEMRTSLREVSDEILLVGSRSG